MDSPVDSQLRRLVEDYREKTGRGFQLPGGKDTRYVIFDQETTGLDPRKDSLVSIGAVGFREGELDLGDTFEMMVRFEFNTSAVVVHGVTREEAADATGEAEAVARFLAYCGNAVFVGHHVLFDFEVLRRAVWRHWGVEVANPCLDTMSLSLALADAGFLVPGPERFDFDTLCARFGIETHDRHTAAGDAFLTANIFLRLSSLARRSQFDFGTVVETPDPFEKNSTPPSPPDQETDGGHDGGDQHHT